MQSIPFTRIRKVVVILTLLLLAGGIGYSLGERRVTVSLDNNQIVINKEPAVGAPVDFSLFWDVWQRIHRYYIDAAQINNRQMVWGAVSGMVNAVGDPYTVFLPPKENTDFKNDLGGEFDGIGAQLGMEDGRIIVVTPLKGSPALAAGILAGDWIIKVDDKDTVNWTIAQAVSNIRGPKGTSVTLTVLHKKENKPTDIVIHRDTIQVPAVDEWVKIPQDIEEIQSLLPSKYQADTTDYVVYVHLSRFGDRLSEEWNQAVNAIVTDTQDKHVVGMVFDLRNNPGGYLDGSVFIASEFLKNGLVVSQVNSDGSREDYQVNRSGKLTNVPLVVLINKGSASAAEIVAGALKDHDRAEIVGETSFGKGSVQTPQDLPDGSGLHITTGKWLTPDGNSIDKKGIEPDVVIPVEDTEATGDAQLAKAVEILLQ